MRNKFIIFVVLLLSVSAAFANEHEHTEDIKEIKLSDKVVSNYGIETQAIDGAVITVPKSAVVMSRDEYLVYVCDDEHFQEIEIHPTKITSDSVLFKNENDAKKIVTNGAKYLRMIFLSNENPDAGHSH